MHFKSATSWSRFLLSKCSSSFICWNNVWGCKCSVSRCVKIILWIYCSDLCIDKVRHKFQCISLLSTFSSSTYLWLPFSCSLYVFSSSAKEKSEISFHFSSCTMCIFLLLVLCFAYIACCVCLFCSQNHIRNSVMMFKIKHRQLFW